MILLNTNKHYLQFSYLTFKDGLISFSGAKADEIIYLFDNTRNDEIIVCALIMKLTPTISEALLLEDESVRENWSIVNSQNLASLNAGLHLFNFIRKSPQMAVRTKIDGVKLNECP